MRLSILASQAEYLRLAAEELLDAIATLSATIEEEGVAITNEIKQLLAAPKARKCAGEPSEVGQVPNADDIVPSKDTPSSVVLRFMPSSGIVSVCGDKVIHTKLQ